MNLKVCGRDHLGCSNWMEGHGTLVMTIGEREHQPITRWEVQLRVNTVACYDIVERIVPSMTEEVGTLIVGFWNGVEVPSQVGN